MENPNIDRQDAENDARAEYSDRVDRFFEDTYNREIAIDILKGWRELQLAFRAEFGEDASIEDECEIYAIHHQFKITREEIG